MTLLISDREGRIMFVIIAIIVFKIIIHTMFLILNKKLL